jgi:hypothetical protein
MLPQLSSSLFSNNTSASSHEELITFWHEPQVSKWCVIMNEYNARIIVKLITLLAELPMLNVVLKHHKLLAFVIHDGHTCISGS